MPVLSTSSNRPNLSSSRLLNLSEKVDNSAESKGCRSEKDRIRKSRLGGRMMSRRKVMPALVGGCGRRATHSLRGQVDGTDKGGSCPRIVPMARRWSNKSLSHGFPGVTMCRVKLLRSRRRGGGLCRLMHLLLHLCLDHCQFCCYFEGDPLAGGPPTPSWASELHLACRACSSMDVLFSGSAKRARSWGSYTLDLDWPSTVLKVHAGNTPGGCPKKSVLCMRGAGTSQLANL